MDIPLVERSCPQTAAAAALLHHLLRALPAARLRGLLDELDQANTTFDEFARQLCESDAPVYLQAMATSRPPGLISKTELPPVTDQHGS